MSRTVLEKSQRKEDKTFLSLFNPALSISFLKSPWSPYLMFVGSAGPLCVPLPRAASEEARFSPALWDQC